MALAEGISSERRSLDEVHGSVSCRRRRARGSGCRRLFARSSGRLTSSVSVTWTQGTGRPISRAAPIRLRADLGPLDVERHGRAVADLSGALGGGDWTRPGAGLPPNIRGRSTPYCGSWPRCHRRDRPGGNHRNYHRPQTAFRPSALVGLPDHGLRHLSASTYKDGECAKMEAVILRSSPRSSPVSDSDSLGPPGYGCGCPAVCSQAYRPARCMLPSESWCNGDAAQLVLALGAGPDPRDRCRRAASRPLAVTT